jgi:hypothetical protein
MSLDVDRISRILRVHSPVNPPATGSSMQITINFKKGNSLNISEWQNTEPQSFTFTVVDPLSLGLSNFEDTTVEKFMDELILVCNLVFEKAAFSKNPADSSRIVVMRKKEKPAEAKVERKEGSIVITINETLTLHDSVHVTGMFSDNLDEKKVLEILSKIIQIKDESVVKTKLQTPDLLKALKEYSSAMSSHDRLTIFKHLFSSIELATNCDGQDRKNSKLDQEINRISGVDVAKIEGCRGFNNRAKHINILPSHKKEYEDGMHKLGENIIYLREASRKVILDRLYKM